VKILSVSRYFEKGQEYFEAIVEVKDTRKTIKGLYTKEGIMELIREGFGGQAC